MRSKLGFGCRITYGSDWSEYFGYQASDGTGDLFFHLDPLWAHPAIDAMVIDNYMPWAACSDSDFSEGSPDGFKTPCDLSLIIRWFNYGDAYEWYYGISGGQLASRRTPINHGVAAKC
ncbi:glycoside hydrolase TIM-barrel-like domain-containing protein [Leuconostoc mesenteroides]|nr:glycoside hydrolase TIM-barrel-like domain-containing protein [Leuconostoc mesenteroides]